MLIYTHTLLWQAPASEALEGFARERERAERDRDRAIQRGEALKAETLACERALQEAQARKHAALLELQRLDEQAESKRADHERASVRAEAQLQEDLSRMATQLAKRQKEHVQSAQRLQRKQHAAKEAEGLVRAQEAALAARKRELAGESARMDAAVQQSEQAMRSSQAQQVELQAALQRLGERVREADAAARDAEEARRRRAGELAEITTKVVEEKAALEAARQEADTAGHALQQVRGVSTRDASGQVTADAGNAKCVAGATRPGSEPRAKRESAARAGPAEGRDRRKGGGRLPALIALPALLRPDEAALMNIPFEMAFFSLPR
jgi:hypothetical protein